MNIQTINIKPTKLTAELQDVAFEYIILDTGCEFGDRQAIENFKELQKYGNES